MTQPVMKLKRASDVSVGLGLRGHIGIELMPLLFFSSGASLIMSVLTTLLTF